jgi:hypothetical protein
MQNLKGTGINGTKEDWLADCTWVRVLEYAGPRGDKCESGREVGECH